MQEGRFFTDIENQHHMPVAVVGADVPRALMNGEDPIGKWIDVNGHKFEMIGVMKRPSAFVSRPGRHANPAALLHHAQDVSRRRRKTC